MTYYQQQISKIRRELYPKDYLYARIIRAKMFIDQYYYDPIDLDTLAEEACFSKFHFIRLFKNIYGKTPHQYLTHVRIEKAKLLLQSPLAVSSICFGVGFDSVSSFTGLFKKMTGSTPSAFQNRHQQLKAAATKHTIKYLPYYCLSKIKAEKISNFEEVSL